MSKTVWIGKRKYLFKVGYFHHSWPHGLKRKVIVWSELGYFHHSWPHGLKRKVIVWSELGYFHHSWQAGIPKWIRQTPNHDFLKSYQTQFGTLNIKIALPWIMPSHEKNCGWMVKSVISPMTVFCGGGVFPPYQFLLPIARNQSCKKCQTSYTDRIRSSDNTAGTLFIVYIAVWERRSSTSKLWGHIKLWVDCTIWNSVLQLVETI